MGAEIALQNGIAPRVCPATLWNISQNCLASSSGESASLAPHIVTVAIWPEKALATPGVASLATVTVTTGTAPATHAVPTAVVATTADRATAT